MSHKSAMIREEKANRIGALAAALKRAQDEAYAEMILNAEDGGSCNMDTVIINLKGWRKADIDQAAAQAGVHIGEKLNGLHRGKRFLFFKLIGQGFRRTRGAESACKYLKSIGYDVSVWYHAD